MNEDLEKMTYYIKNKIEPPKPPFIIFNKKGKIRFQKDKKKYVIIGCHEKNWEVERSVYFTLMTGLKEKEDWISSIKGEIADKNDEIKANYIERNNL